MWGTMVVILMIERSYFQEFLMATNMSNPGSAEEKLKWIFEMYDEDGSGMMVHNKTFWLGERVLHRSAAYFI